MLHPFTARAVATVRMHGIQEMAGSIGSGMWIASHHLTSCQTCVLGPHKFPFPFRDGRSSKQRPDPCHYWKERLRYVVTHMIYPKTLSNFLYISAMQCQKYRLITCAYLHVRTGASGKEYKRRHRLVAKRKKNYRTGVKKRGEKTPHIDRRVQRKTSNPDPRQRNRETRHDDMPVLVAERPAATPSFGFGFIFRLVLRVPRRHCGSHHDFLPVFINAK